MDIISTLKKWLHIVLPQKETLEQERKYEFAVITNKATPNNDMTNKINHLAIIMDGNGRWAKKRGLPRHVGHQFGAKALYDISNYIYDNNICNVFTVFAFSTENWQRPKIEIQAFLKIMQEYIHDYKQQLLQKQIKVRFIGDLSLFPMKLRQQLEQLEAQSSSFTGLCFNIALNYGGRDEIIHVIDQLSDLKKQKEVTVTYDLIKQHSFLGNIPDPDLIIRSGGEQRLSNFLLLQSAYSELYFDDTFWPDYSSNNLLAAIAHFKKINRRFGGVKNNEQLSQA